MELRAQGERLVLDAGLPLGGDRDRTGDRPDVPGLWRPGQDAPRAVLITHGHLDHCGLAPDVEPSVPVYMGEGAAAVLEAARFFRPGERGIPVAGHLRHRAPLRFGPFTVTPFLVDHSGFDSYAVLVAADGRRLLYSGDVRSHGRKPRTLGALADEAAPVDVLVLEGTRVRRGGDDRPDVSERDVELRCAALARETPGMVLAFHSPQNIDRVVTLYRAARRAGRTFVMDLYTATVAAATGRATIPQAGWEGVRVFVPRSQRIRVKESGEFHRVEAIRDARIHLEELPDYAPELFVSCRGSMVQELERFGCLPGAHAIWSLWPGYLEEGSGARTAAELAAAEVPLTVEHASGHANPLTLTAFVDRLRPGRVVPVHTGAPETFAELIPGADVRPDGAWWPV